MIVYRGENIRLTEKESELMQKIDEPGPLPEDLVKYVKEYQQIDALQAFDKAHILTQLKAGTLSVKEASKMLSEMRQWEKDGKVTEYRTNTGDYKILHSGEALLSQRLGKELGGKLHLGRSSGDLGVVSFRITLRDKIMQIMDATNELRKVTLDASEKYISCIMPGYTHLQDAQPITLGHYFSFYAENFARDFERLKELYGRVNRSPAGAAILTGNEFHMDREYEKDLLGFDSVQVNTIDSIWGKDTNIECYSTVAILMENIGRLAEDLIIFSTEEFSLMELADCHCGTSSIMPQKKNPYALETLKAIPAFFLGGFAQAMMIYKGSYAECVHENARLYTEIWRMYDEAIIAIKLAAEVVSKLKPNEERMLKRAKESWCVGADLAGAMFSNMGITFREAHQIVGIIVRHAVENHLTPLQLTKEMVDQASVELRGIPLGMSQEQIEEAVDPANSIMKKDMIGGPNPDRMRKDLSVFNNTFIEDTKWVNNAKQYLAKSAAFMESEIDRIINSTEA